MIRYCATVPTYICHRSFSPNPNCGKNEAIDSLD